MTRKLVFVSAVGQDDNVGDSVLRRGYLNVLREAGELHILVSQTSDAYRSGLGILPGDVLYERRSEWWYAANSKAASHPVVVAFNAGEMQLNKTFVRSYARHGALIIRARKSGGFGVHIGMGIRRKTWLGRPIGAILRLCRFVSWRDAFSQSWTHVGTVTPDWAFSFDGSGAPSQQRPLLAISLRGDRLAPSPRWLETIEAVAVAAGLTPTLVVQVERDNELAEQLARERGWALESWTGGPHAQREREIRDVYAMSSAVVSDRLHALVIGSTEGAVPIAYSDADISKARRTLSAAGLGDFYVDTAEHGENVSARMLKLIDQRLRVQTAVVDARTALSAWSKKLGSRA